MKILILTALVVSCGATEAKDYRHVPTDDTYPRYDPRSFKTIESDFIDTANKFSTEFGVGLKDLSIGYRDFEGTAGVCWSYSSGHREIWVSLNYRKIKGAQKEQLLYHELGHCLLGLEHNDEHEDERPESIMRSWAFNGYEIENYYTPTRPRYINEMLQWGMLK